MQEAFDAIGKQTEQMQLKVAQSIRVTDKSLGQYFVGIQQGLNQLNRLLTSLGEEKVVVQQVQKRGGLFSFGRNGKK